MSKLPISKDEEVEAIARVWNMGLHSLDPEKYGALEASLRQLCDNRNLHREGLAWQQILMSGKKTHCSDCETSGSPANITGPCDCDC